MLKCLTMTSLKTKNIWFLAAFLFLSIVTTLAEVINSVSDCNQFFRQGTPPSIPGVLVNGVIQDNNRYKVICQTFEGERRFLTVYDINNKIPVFSAYEYRGPGSGKATESWMIEPQLESGTDLDKNMMKQDCSKTYTNQAVNVDYNNKLGLDRGHLFPSLHAFTSIEKTSTYTLTNIVPQADTFNQGRWNTMEKCIQCVMNYYINTKVMSMRCFVVVGAQPSDNKKLSNKINIPDMLWSAFYCNNNKGWSRAGAHWDANDAGKITDHMVMKNLTDLNSELNSDLFPGQTPKFPEEGMKGCKSNCVRNRVKAIQRFLSYVGKWLLKILEVPPSEC